MKTKSAINVKKKLIQENVSISAVMMMKFITKIVVVSMRKELPKLKKLSRKQK